MTSVMRWRPSLPQDQNIGRVCPPAPCTGAALADSGRMYMNQRELGPERTSSDTRESEAAPWTRRLQRVRLRTKIVVPILALAVIPATTIGLYTTSRMRDALREDVVERLAFDVASKSEVIEDFLQGVQQDLLFLGQSAVVGALVHAEATATTEELKPLRRRVEEMFLVFSQGKRAYYQLRYLSRDGREMVRLNVDTGQPTIVPADQLQEKSHRYYVQAALSLEPGEIYVSPVDLNVEHGTVERPHRAVLRYATTVTGNGRGGRGLVVVNIDVDHLFALIGPLPVGAAARVVDEDGTYLGSLGESDEHSRRYDVGQQRHLAADFSAQEVATILASPVGAITVETEDRVLSFTSVAYDSRVPGRQWLLMVAYPRGPTLAPVRQLTAFLPMALLLAVTVAGILGVLVAHYVAQPVASLRRATREITAGNLSKRVEVTTGDEIEGLANDFNTMTEQLQHAQARLSSWNEELEREVAHQTDHLHQLQTGLARTDKLAAMGQMTASIMHEIGNPMAAIKTSIQVAMEEEAAGKDYEALLSDIIEEVDRLTAFLRSFPRLSQLPDLLVRQVSLGEVVGAVTTLVTPELRSSGVALDVDLADNLPMISGDVDQLRHLLINLVLNGAQASPDGGTVLVRVQRAIPGFETQGGSGGARIDVVDHGAGMTDEILAKIWEPFFTTKANGSGLGLTICRQIVLAHAGRILVKSSPHEGTVVTVILPGVREHGSTRDHDVGVEKTS